jgi:translocation and assembly module TamB
MKPWGQWNVTELSGKGVSGRFEASAIARLDGFRLKSAEAHVRVPQGDKIPLAAQGSALGSAWGRIDAAASMSPDGRHIAASINVPSLHVDLEDAVAHAVQSTDPNPTIRVGVHGPHGKMQLLPFDGSKPIAKPEPPKPTNEPPTTVRIATHLGPDFEVRRGTMLKVAVTKGPTLDLGAKTTLSGELDFPHGYVELQGKRFKVVKGTVNFTGQPPDNPIVIASAVYEAPDGTKVFADFTGPVKTGKLTLRSDPTLSQNEILALLLFGSTSGTFGQAAPQGEQGNQTTQATSVAGGVVTQGLNKALSGISGVEIQTKVDTEQSGDPRPEVEVGLSRTVSATIIYNLGVPPPGQNPDDTLLMVDWRFHKDYSTEATLGDRGTTILDLAWKYRY